MIVLTLLLFLLFAFLIVWITGRSTPGLTMAEVIAAFGFKALMACTYGYLFLHYYGGDDTWQTHIDALREYDLLMNSPGRFFSEFFSTRAWHSAKGDGWHAFRMYLLDLEYFMIVKTLAIFNIISRGYYYSNAVFFSFLTFWGHFWFFKLMAGLFPQKRKMLLLVIFFFPPTIFWLSGIRSDGLILLFVSLVLVHAFRWIYQRKNISLIYILLGLAGVFILRNTVVLLLLPALVCWAISVRSNRRPLLVFATVYGIATVLFFVSGWLPGFPNLSMIIVERQQEFLALQGNTRFRLDALEPNMGSFIRVLPQAIGNTFLRPFLWEARGILQIMTALEIIMFWVLVVLAIVRRDKSIASFSPNGFLWALACFSISLYLFIGYVTPFPGAIVRYKAMAELFLLALLVVRINVRNPPHNSP